jgi:DNA-directed RNA polymerase specialized sigma24 family protein
VDRPQRAELQQLFERLASGDREALEPAFSLLWPALRSFARRMLADDAAGDDAAQSALLKIFTRSSELDLERDALTWALGVTAYECRTLRKQTQRRRESGDRPLTAERARVESPEDATIARQLEQAALEVLGALRPIDIETLHALMHDERPDVSAVTFRKRVERALHRLQVAWRSRHGHD